MPTCDRCGRTFVIARYLEAHIANCARLPKPAQLLTEIEASNRRVVARRYGINPNWLEEHALALSSPNRGPLCRRCGVGSAYGGPLDLNGWCGWCRQDVARQHAAQHLYTALVIGRITPDSAELETHP